MLSRRTLLRLSLTVGALGLALYAVAGRTVAQPNVAVGRSWVKPGSGEAEALRRLLGEPRLAGRWVYHDLEAARAEAARTGKPLLVLFRCVPCACAKVLNDEVVAEQSKTGALQEEFVCVRVVQMNGVDLEQFQFERDLSFATMFMNADGTVYGRYGTRASVDRRAMTHISHASFEKAMRRALDLHKGYPANRALFADKRGTAVKVRYAEEMPQMKPFGFQTSVKDCIHCHMVGEADLEQRKKEGRLTVSDVWQYPLPENVGLKLDTDDGLLVKSVSAGSPAAEAGMRAGDRLTAMNGQPLISQADVQWVLHHLPVESVVTVAYQRGGTPAEAKLSLSGDWKKTQTTWRATVEALRPGMRLRPDLFKQNKGIGPKEMALIVNYPHGAAAKAGLRNEDRVLAVDGRTDMLLEADVLAYIHLSDPRPRALKLKVWRKGETFEATLPLE